MVQSRLDVAIVGGGIGGLFAANALCAKGVQVSLYEQAPAIGEVGAGVFLTPNSVRHLQRIGLEPAVEKWGARVGHDSRYFRHDGAPIAPVQVTDSSGWPASPMMSIWACSISFTIAPAEQVGRARRL